MLLVLRHLQEAWMKTRRSGKKTLQRRKRMALNCKTAKQKVATRTIPSCDAFPKSWSTVIMKKKKLDVNTDLGNRKYKSTLLACVQSSTVGLQKLKKKTLLSVKCAKER